MCKVVESENGSPPRLKFDRGEWVKLLSIGIALVVLANGGTLVALRSHTGDTQLHQTIPQKQSQTYSIVDREMLHHVESGPHAGVAAAIALLTATNAELKVMNENFDRRLTRLENE